jgi:uncharacterized protein YjbJ (UPF0337 family)
VGAAARMRAGRPGTSSAHDETLDETKEHTVGLDDKVQHQATDAKGRAKEAAGTATGNESLKAEGKEDQAKAKAKEAGRHVKEAAKDAKDTFKS